MQRRGRVRGRDRDRGHRRRWTRHRVLSLRRRGRPLRRGPFGRLVCTGRRPCEGQRAPRGDRRRVRAPWYMPTSRAPSSRWASRWPSPSTRRQLQGPERVGPASWKRRPHEVTRAIDAWARSALRADSSRWTRSACSACRRAATPRSRSRAVDGRPRASPSTASTHRRGLQACVGLTTRSTAAPSTG